MSRFQPESMRPFRGSRFRSISFTGPPRSILSFPSHSSSRKETSGSERSLFDLRVSFQLHKVRDRTRASLARLLCGLRHAFANPASEPLSEEESRLIGQVAESVVRRGLSAPCLLFLECSRPLNFVASQALHALTPGFAMVLDSQTLGRLGRILERRECVDTLIENIREEEKKHGR